jgi:hypothetical protein
MLSRAEGEPERYRGRPLLVVLENYVLDTIGALPTEKQSIVSGLVSRVFGGGEDWKKTVRDQLRFDDSIDAVLREMWERNQQLAVQQQTVLHPVQFAKMVVDDNFAHLIDPLVK